MKMFAQIFSITIGFLFVINSALAHNTLTGSAPSDQAILTGSPDAIQLNFSDATYLEGIELTTSDGKKIALDFELIQTAARQFSIPVPVLGNGKYRVDWLVVGDDTHEIRGEFSFEVNASAVNSE